MNNVKHRKEHIMLTNKSLTFDQFLSKCTMCGGNWTEMFLTGIEACWPEIYKSMPDWTYAFEDVCFVVNTLCCDKDTTWAGVHVDKFRGFEFPEHRISVTENCFIFEEEEPAKQALKLDDWYTQECGVDPATIKAFEQQMHRKQNIKDCSSIIWDLCHAWHEGNETGLYLDNHKIYTWLLEQDSFVNEAQEATNREMLRSICERWFDDQVLELPWSMIGMKD